MARTGSKIAMEFMMQSYLETLAPVQALATSKMRMMMSLVAAERIFFLPQRKKPSMQSKSGSW
ncbi:hypothetical protein DITRI_Ditri12bG0036200 [Diplodiscus trichospermus]